MSRTYTGVGYLAGRRLVVDTDSRRVTPDEGSKAETAAKETQFMQRKRNS